MQPFGGRTGLPRTTGSVCPECVKVIKAVVKEKDGKVVMEKECSEHGQFTDIISTDVEFYRRMEKYAHDGVGIENPFYKDFKGCPTTCGMCTQHKSHTALALIDLTNRCNLKCPVCFANANSAGYVYELSKEQIHLTLKTLREQKPVPTVAVQFSGGEPTISPFFLDACRMAHDLGIAQVQVASNGIRLANDSNFARECAEHHLHTVYLQFDAVDDAIYKQVRGVPLFETKKRAIENCRKALVPGSGKKGRPRPLSVILVPTVVKGFNDGQIMPIVDFAIDNLDVVRGVNFQPVALTARLPERDRFSMRFTQADLVKVLCAEGPFEKTDFFPVPSMAPISELVSIIHGVPKLAFTCHPGCGCATFAFVDRKSKKVTPLPQFMDIDGFFNEIEDLIQKYRESRLRRVRTALSAARLRSGIAKFIDFRKAPAGITEKNVTALIASIFSEGSKEAVANFTWDTLYIGNMHFQDGYNYDIHRLMRCDIHYATPDGRVIPFCAYNSGPVFRDEVEMKFSVPLAEWRKRVLEQKKGQSFNRLSAIGTGGEVAVGKEAYSGLTP